MIYKLARSINSNMYEDLFQAGVIGLIYAYNNYDESYNTKFSTYAYSYILGEMKKLIRCDKGIKISKDLTYLSTRLDKLIYLLSQKYNRSPTIEELSKETNIDEDKIIEALNIRDIIKSLDDNVTDDLTLLDTVKTYDKDNTIIDEMLNTLSTEELEFIRNRYYLDKSQQEMSNIYGYSQAKVSRMESKILLKLRSYYKD